MKLLFDFITLRKKTGAGEYIRRIFSEVIRKVESEHLPIEVYAIYDSSTPIVYSDMQESALSKVKFLDVCGENISQLIKKNQIDRFFIGCAQYIGEYAEACDIDCEVICVVHDLSYEEMYYNKTGLLYKLLDESAEEPPKLTWKEKVKKLFFPHTHYDRFSKWYVNEGGNMSFAYTLNWMRTIMKLYRFNPLFQFVAVSDYTKSSMMYYFDVPSEKIKVLYSPERIIKCNEKIENSRLYKIIEEKRKYYLLVSAHAMTKNAVKAIRAFQKYCRMFPDSFLLTLGYGKEEYENHIDLPFLSDGDLGNAHAHCYALLYPSFFEGFGYPPIEAMHYGKPVLCSNATSMPYILGDAPIYFSPLYESAIFNALGSLTNEKYIQYCEKSRIQYTLIHERQEKDLQTIVNMIIGT